jgi:hypothetical protein
VSLLPTKKQLLQPTFPLVNTERKPEQWFGEYMRALDALVGMLGAGLNNLPNAANDGAAAAAGVPVGGLYRTGSQISVRVA